MQHRPTPVLVVSSAAGERADVAVEALAAGAAELLCKPRAHSPEDLNAYAETLTSKLRDVASLKVEKLLAESEDRAREAAFEARISRSAAYALPVKRVIAIGASTGGNAAIRTVVADLASDLPPVLVVQHIPKMFSEAFARGLGTCSGMIAQEAKDGEALCNGHIYVAPGDRHLTIARSKGQLICRLDQGDAVNGHRPSVDVLFHSVAKVQRRHAMGVLLTGMGTDGAKGLLAMRENGAATLAQDEKSSAVWGMPRAAVRLDAAEQVLPLTAVAGAIDGFARKNGATS